MRVIAKSRLRNYWNKRQYREAEQQLRAWYDEIRKGSWKNFNELKRDYPTASIVGNNRVVFNIKGNAFRLIIKFEFKMNAVFIRFFGTHKEYDNINASEA
jgi:mRNA interferase HigB